MTIFSNHIIYQKTNMQILIQDFNFTKLKNRLWNGVENEVRLHEGKSFEGWKKHLIPKKC